MQLLHGLFATVAALSVCEGELKCPFIQANLLISTASVVVARDPSPEIGAAEILAAQLLTVKRALPNSPSGGYAPKSVTCPSERPTIRQATGLSSGEESWIPIRRNKTIDPMSSFLSRMNIPNFDAASYINTHRNNASALPNIGIGISGGGYRALMNGGGFLAAADNRTTNSTEAGGIGGLLQATTYLAGLSGGGWLVGSIYSNNFSSVQALRDGSSGSDLWAFDRSIFEGPESSGISILNTADYFTDLIDQVKQKQDAGFNASITDYWGRALSYQLVNATDGGPSYTFSSISEQDFFTNGDVPFPALVADSRAPGTKVVSLNSTLFEINPFEVGSWDPTTYAFAPLRYAGSNFSAGVVPTDGDCVEGFDQVGYVMGTSSTLFNQALLTLNTSALPDIFSTAITAILTDLGDDYNDIAQWQPNPFFNYNNGTNRNAISQELTLVDGGEDGQNIPLNPLIQPFRAVDIIFAIDSSADTTFFWPNGTSLVATYQRSLNATIENGTAFPSIPDQNTFVNLGLNTRPTFFGCNASNITGDAPLLVYVPNAPYIVQSNVSTFDLEYNNTQRNAIIRNGYEVATLGNGTEDSQWGVCVACAVLSRSWTRTNTDVPQACTDCFNRYCWNGTVDSSTPPEYDPTFKGQQVSITGESGGVALDASRVFVAVVAIAVGVAVMM
jgi:lysophospholipase